MARTHRHAPAHRAPESTGREDWRAIIKARDTKRELRRAHARNSAPRQQTGRAVLVTLAVSVPLALCAAVAARGLWHAVASALQAMAMHGGV